MRATVLDPVRLTPPNSGRPTVALVAHDQRKSQLVDFAICYRDVLSAHRLVATATTGRMLAAMVGLRVEYLSAGADGGDRDVAHVVKDRRVAAVIFLVDPFCHAGEPTIDRVLRACNLHEVPLATNIATATAILTSLSSLAVHHSISRSAFEEK